MNKIVFIKQNSRRVRNVLKDAGYTVCHCATYHDAVWLNYRPENPFYNDIHGTGCYAESCKSLANMSPEDRINFLLSIEDYYPKEREFFDTVEDFLKAYPKPKTN